MAAPTPQVEPTPPAEPIAATYHGQPGGTPGHEFIAGVPARDLTASEYAALTPDQQQQVAETTQSSGEPLYTVANAPAAAPPTAPSTEGVPATPQPAPQEIPQPAPPVEYPAPAPTPPAK